MPPIKPAMLLTVYATQFVNKAFKIQKKKIAASKATHHHGKSQTEKSRHQYCNCSRWMNSPSGCFQTNLPQSLHQWRGSKGFLWCQDQPGSRPPVGTLLNLDFEWPEKSEWRCYELASFDCADPYQSPARCLDDKVRRFSKLIHSYPAWRSRKSGTAFRPLHTITTYN